MGRAGAVNVPVPLVVTARCTPVSSLWTTTLALEMTAPLASVTVPEIVPLTTWAEVWTAFAERAANRIKKRDRFVRVVRVMRVS